MIRTAVLLGSVVVLAACSSAPAPRGTGGAQSQSVSFDTGTVSRFATGPIGTACLIHDRRNASRALCGCVQAAADMTLSQADQQRGVRFFSEPEMLNEIKVSDSVANEAFWDRWDRFSETAERLCGSA